MSLPTSTPIPEVEILPDGHLSNFEEFIRWANANNPIFNRLWNACQYHSVPLEKFWILLGYNLICQHDKMVETLINTAMQQAKPYIITPSGAYELPIKDHQPKSHQS